MKKATKILFTTFACVATALFATACSQCNASEPTEFVRQNVVTLQTESCELLLGDEYLLDAYFEYDSKANLAFTSSDESVVTVDQNGQVLAIGSGEATVTVTYGNASDTCAFKVGMGNLLAMLEYKDLPKENIRITTADTLDLAASVSFNGKTYEDMQVTYTLSDDTFGKIENGVFLPTKTGKVEIYATATWHGMTGDTLTKTIPVEILKDVQIFVNNGMNSSFLLYTLSDEQISVSAGARENGTAIEEVSLELVSGQQFVDFTNGKISSKGMAGEAILKAYCTDMDGEYWEREFSVKVTQTVLTYEGEQITNFSAVDGEVVGGKTIAQSIGGKIVRADDENGNPLTVENGKIMGVETSSTGESEITLTAYTQRAGYKLTIKGYSGIFDEAEDFAFFGMKNHNYINHPLYDPDVPSDRGYTFGSANQNGYYILANNIDASDYTQPDGGYNMTNGLAWLCQLQQQDPDGFGLTGTLDGRGYTVRGLTVSRFGIFGIICGGTVKNIAFTDVKFTSTAGGGIFAQYALNAVLQNVYVQTDRLQGALVSWGMSGVFMSGCLIDVPQTTYEAGLGTITTDAQKLVNGNKYISLNGFNGVYVVSKIPLCYVSSYTIDAENKEDLDPKYVFSGVYRYDTAEEMSAAYTGGKEYENFISDYWTIENGMPVWKTRDFVIDDTIVYDDKTENFNPDWIEGVVVVMKEEGIRKFNPDWIKE